MLNRRTVLQLAIAGTLGRIGPAPAALPAAAELGNDPALLLQAYMRLAGSLDDRLVIWWMDGQRYGVTGARARLLFGMQVGMFHRFFAQPDGTYKLAMFELTYYTDLETGALLETFDNPYTGETNRVRHVRLGPEIRHQTPAGTARPDNALVREYASSMGPAVVNGDDLWIPNAVEASIRFPGERGLEILLNHYTTVHGKLHDALNATLLSAPCTLAFQNVIKWEPFMNMGDHPGHMMSRAAGRKLERVDQLPPGYLEMAERIHPKLIADPRRTLDKLSARLGDDLA
jgi:hypothetical protein